MSKEAVDILITLTKTDLDAALAEIDQIKTGELPTRIVSGKEKPVHKANYIRRRKKQTSNAHFKGVAYRAAASVIADGYPDAVGITRGNKTIIYHDGVGGKI